MKKLFLLVCFFLVNQNYIYSHGQGVHQHLLRESYKLLKYYVGQDIRAMKDHVGYNETGSGIYNPGGLLVIGAHREDEEDARYQNGIFDYNVTMTHFLDADLGDNSTYNFLGSSYPNAYQKALTYYNGSFVLFIPASNPSAIDRKLHVTTPLGDQLIIYPDEPQYGGFYFSYYSLVDMYKNCRLITQLIGKNQMWNVTKQRWEYWRGDVYISTELRDRLVWELLGRVCHLLGDMSVPAHAHNDSHWPDLDSYEEWMNQPSIYNLWTYQNAINQGSLINPTVQSNPLKYLFYSTSQITGFFPSDDVNGNGGSGINDPFSSYPGLNEFINTLNSQYGNPPTHSDPIPSNLMNAISNNNFVYAMRTISSLLYLFAKEAGLLPQPLTGVSVWGDYSLYLGSTGYWNAYLINGLEPFTYNWQIKYIGSVSAMSSGSKPPVSTDKIDSGGIIINAPPSDYWLPVGLNSSTFSRINNGSNLRDFKLRCIVRDGSNTTITSNEFLVDVLSQYPPMQNIIQDNSEKQNLALAKESTKQIIPVEYSLHQNYPNPFNPYTKISYSLSESNQVSIVVYDVLGCEVKTLVNEFKSSGNYEIDFDASNLSSGTYIYRMIAGSYQATRKLLVIK